MTAASKRPRGQHQKRGDREGERWLLAEVSWTRVRIPAQDEHGTGAFPSLGLSLHICEVGGRGLPPVLRLHKEQFLSYECNSIPQRKGINCTFVGHTLCEH